jgi:hypothetical protein
MALCQNGFKQGMGRWCAFCLPAWANSGMSGGMAKKQMKKQIREIMDNFDFARVHDVMKKLNWRWVGAVPTKKEIKKQAKSLLRHVSSYNEIVCSSTGGLRAENNNGQLRLAFEVTDWAVEEKE